MKIYFAGAIRAGRDDAPVYGAMITWLRSFGEVLTEHVGDLALSSTGDDGPSDRHIHDRDMAWLASSDLVIAEVTTPSLGVGYELGWATALAKPVLCLYRTLFGRPLSAMIGGNPCMHRDFPELCRIFREEVPNKMQRGLWTNNYFKHREVIEETFGTFNLNSHGAERAEANLFDLHKTVQAHGALSWTYGGNSDHSPILTAVRRSRGG